jgi:hypothetical protein
VIVFVGEVSRANLSGYSCRRELQDVSTYPNNRASLDGRSMATVRLTGIVDRNGSVEVIKKIIGYLNEAKLDPQVGKYTSIRLSSHTGVNLFVPFL